MLQSKLYLFLLLLIFNATKLSLIPLVLNIPMGPSQLLCRFIASFVLDFAVMSVTFKSRKPYFYAVFYFFQTVYLAANVYSFLYFDTIIHLNYVNYLFWESLAAIKHLYIPRTTATLLIFADLPLALYLLTLYQKLHVDVANLRKYRSMLLGSLALLAAIYGGTYATATPLKVITNDVLFDKVVVARYGLLAHNLLDLFKDSGSIHTINQVMYAPKVVVGHGGKSTNNIVMIQVESLDANIIDHMHNGKYVAPFLHDLAAKSLYYPYTLCYRRAGGTSDCEIAVLNSIEPLENSPLIKSDTYRYPNSLVKVLKKNGYRAQAFHGNIGEFYNRDHAYPHMGFDEFYGLEKLGVKPQGWGASDENLFAFVLNKMSRQKEPFLDYVITMSSHEPFDLVDSYYVDHSYDDISYPLVRDYFRSISYVDGVLKKFITTVRQRYHNCFVIMYGDHTPYVINEGPYKRASILGAKGEMEFVPLFIVTPDNKVYRENRKVSSYLDVASTVLAASGVNFKIQSSGTNLLNPFRTDEVSYFNSSYSRTELFSVVNKTPLP
jgi:lipoteichoic acid synthase